MSTPAKSHDPDLPVDLLELAKDNQSCPENGQDQGEALPNSVLENPIGPADENRAVVYEPFFNAREGSGNHDVKRERPEHRIMCYLKLQGKTNKEIAEELGRTPQNVADVLGQKWAQEFMAKELARRGEPMVELILKGEALTNINKLIAIRDDQQISAETRRKAINDLLDRTYGKAAQVIAHVQADASSLTDEELAKIAAQGRTN